jgi:hypothetical protein
LAVIKLFLENSKKLEIICLKYQNLRKLHEFFFGENHHFHHFVKKGPNDIIKGFFEKIPKM